jgi:sugar fermentation stimulation protein A
MIFGQRLLAGKLIRRYKRFLADIEMESGETVTAHCPNSGSMKTCTGTGWKVLLSDHPASSRKYRYTWEMVHNGKCWIGINTGIPNLLAAEAIRAGKIPELKEYPVLRREQKYGRNSRIDLLLSDSRQTCFVEVKNVTLVERDGNYYFPDSVTERGRKHLSELMTMVDEGHRAVMLFIIQRSDGRLFRPAKHIDPKYAESLQKAYKHGVEILVYRAEVSPQKIEITGNVAWDLNP